MSKADIAFIIAISLVAVWFITSVYILVRAWVNINKVNYYILDSIPAVFSTLGVFGTFLGITVGLYDFDFTNIEASIPNLLEGMKTAFVTSTLGIGSGLVFSKFVSTVKQKWDRAGTITSAEVQKLSDLIGVMKQSNDENKRHFLELRNAISSDNDDSLATHFTRMRQQNREQNEALLKALGGDSETSLLTQMQRMREEQLDIGKQTQKGVEQINENVRTNKEVMAAKFDEFTTLLEKSNTEALVKAIENVIGGFNERLSELIEKLVQENFRELNNSVQRLNDWQQANKEQVAALIAQFTDVSDRLKISAESLRSISISTDSLVNNDSALVKLVKELEDVLVKETNLRKSMELLTVSTKDMKETSDTLNEWIEREHTFAEAVEGLIESLKEIEELRNNASGFWTDVKNQMNQGVGILKTGNEDLMRQVTRMEQSFQERMNASFVSLDKVLQAMVIEYHKRPPQQPPR